MDLASKKLPLALIVVLVAVLAVQAALNSPAETRVDAETCEVYEGGPGQSDRRYLGEFDQECLDGRP